MNLWILFKSSVLADFFCHCPNWGDWVLPCYCRMEIEVHVSHLATVNKGAPYHCWVRLGPPVPTSPLLMPPWFVGVRVLCYYFLCGLHWHHSAGEHPNCGQWWKSPLGLCSHYLIRGASLLFVGCGYPSSPCNLYW